MHAMVLRNLNAPLEWTELPDPVPGPGEIRVHVAAWSMANFPIRECLSSPAMKSSAALTRSGRESAD